jgi:O-antigen/teichoic acid export membrane protein
LAWFFLSRVAATLVAVITLVVLTRLLPAEDFARYTMIILAGMIAQQFTFNWIFSSITRFHSSADFEGRAVAYGLGATAATTLGLAPVLLAVGFMVPSEWLGIYILTVSVAWSTAVYELALACLRVQERGPLFALSAVSRPVLSTGLAVLLLLHGGGFQGAVLALVIASLIGGTIGVAVAGRQSGVRRPDGFSLRTFFAFGQPLSVVSSGAMLFPLTSQLILAAMVGLEPAGYFAAAMTLSERSLVMVMITLGQTSAATIFATLEREGDERLVAALDHHFTFLLLIAAPLASVLIFAGGTLSRVFFGPAIAAGAAPLLPLLGLAALVQGIQGAFFAFIFMMRRKTMLQLGLAAALLVFHLGATFLLVRAFGAFGAAYATVLTAFATTILYAYCGWSLFRRCALGRPALQIGAAIAAAAPFLMAADRTASVVTALALIAAGMLAMLIVLKLVRYTGLEIIIESIRLRLTS